MKYITEQFVRKTESPILCRFDGKEMSFDSGAGLANYQFDKKYEVDTVSLEEGKIVIALKESVSLAISSVGEELVQTEDWIKEHKERYGVEPNLFDGA